MPSRTTNIGNAPPHVTSTPRATNNRASGVAEATISLVYEPLELAAKVIQHNKRPAVLVGWDPSRPDATQGSSVMQQGMQMQGHTRVMNTKS